MILNVFYWYFENFIIYVASVLLFFVIRPIQSSVASVFHATSLISVSSSRPSTAGTRAAGHMWHWHVNLNTVYWYIDSINLSNFSLNLFMLNCRIQIIRTLIPSTGHIYVFFYKTIFSFETLLKTYLEL